MKVLFIHNRYQERGGEDVAVEQEVKLLREKGHEVEFMLFENAAFSGLADKIRTGIRAIHNRQSAAKVATRIKQFQPDVIHVHNLFFVASPAVLIIASKLGVPVVLTLHNYRLICANALLLRDNKPCELCIHHNFPLQATKYKCYRNSSLESALVTAITGFHKIRHTWQKKVDYFICLNEFNKQKFINSSLHVPEEHLVVKPNFIPDPGVGVDHRKPYFLFVGRLSPEKGAHIMLQAFASMPERQLVVVGDGPEKTGYESTFGHHSNIIFKGNLPRHKVLQLLKESQSLVFPSIWYEGLPFTILEAFATGTPVISSRLGAMESMISHEYNGLHFEPGSSADLQKAIARFSALGDVEHRQLCRNARLTYLNNYHSEVHYQTIIEIYSKAINNRKLK